MIEAVRRAQEVLGRPLAVIADLQGPKIRIGVLAEPRAVNRATGWCWRPWARARPATSR